MKVAIIHDWLVVYAGAERVLEQFIICYPDADIFSLIDVLPLGQRQFLQHKTVQTSFLQRMPLIKTKYRYYLPLMPLAIEQFDLSKYDLIISSSHAVAKGVLTAPHQVHICYCHSPMRYIWDMQHEYLAESNTNKQHRKILTRYLLHKLRIWDYRTAAGVDFFIANSHFIAQRIYKTYRRNSIVINPPVDIAAWQLCRQKQDYFVVLSRLVPYKHVLLIAAAFKEMPHYQLKIAGAGPQQQALLKSIKDAPNITYLGFVEHPQVLVQQARAMIVAAAEDFGISTVEAQAAGTPVIAFNRGGSAEIIQGLKTAQPTGVFFTTQSTAAIITAVKKFTESNTIYPDNCHKNALKYNLDRFNKQISEYINTCMIETNTITDNL